MIKPIKTIGQEFLGAVAKDDEWYNRVLEVELEGAESDATHDRNPRQVEESTCRYRKAGKPRD